MSSTSSSELAGELVEKIRMKTGLSHEMSQVTLETVLNFLQQRVGNLPEEINLICESLTGSSVIRNNLTLIDKSSDACQLRQIFRKLTECKDDEQQRSWALHEDEGMILENLERLIQILREADQSIIVRVLERDNYECLNALILYYQMEIRWSIRELLLETFASISSIDRRAVSVFVNSILPMELAREITDNSENVPRILMTASLLSLLWSSGEGMPVTHVDQIGEKFLSFIFDSIEDPPDGDDRVIDTFMNLVLAYNLQFQTPCENIVLTVVGKRRNAKEFTQKTVHLLNWEEDPIAVLPHEPKPPNSILKLVTDLFSSPETSEIFYTNDVKVLIDIVTRCVTDLGSHDPRRLAYLRLLHLVMKNSTYVEHQHRKADLQKTFTGILLEEDPAAKVDQEVVNDILEQFPHIFS